MVAHHHSEIVLGNFFCQHPELLITLRHLGLVQRVFGALALLLQLGRSRVLRRQKSYALEREGFRDLESLRVLVEVRLASASETADLSAT